MAQVDSENTTGMPAESEKTLFRRTDISPEDFFQALGRLVSVGKFGQGRLKVRFRASGNDAMLDELVRRYGLQSLVEVLPPIDYRGALAEMLRADGLLILQAANCNEQIPAKLYEYLRAGRPLLALTDPSGDTAAAVRAAGIGAIARLDSPDEIAVALDHFVEAIRQGRAVLPETTAVARLERREQARDLARLLDEARLPA